MAHTVETVAAFLAGVVMVAALWLGNYISARLQERQAIEQQFERFKSDWDKR